VEVGYSERPVEVPSAQIPDSSVVSPCPLLCLAVLLDAPERVIEDENFGPPTSDLRPAYILVAALYVTKQAAEPVAVVLRAVSDERDVRSVRKQSPHRFGSLVPPHS
jgi:hypothetical protein